MDRGLEFRLNLDGVCHGRAWADAFVCLSNRTYSGCPMLLQRADTECMPGQNQNKGLVSSQGSVGYVFRNSPAREKTGDVDRKKLGILWRVLSANCGRCEERNVQEEQRSACWGDKGSWAISRSCPQKNGWKGKGAGRLEVQLSGGVHPCAREEKLEKLSGRRWLVPSLSSLVIW